MKKQNKALAVVMGSLGIVAMSTASENPFHAQPLQHRTETSMQEKASELPKPATAPDPANPKPSEHNATTKKPKHQYDRRWPEGSCGASSWAHRH